MVKKLRLKTPTLKLEGRLNLEMEPLHSNLKIKGKNYVSDKMSAGWSVTDPDPIAMQVVGGDRFWVHTMSHLDKPLTTRVGVAGHVTSKEK